MENREKSYLKWKKYETGKKTGKKGKKREKSYLIRNKKLMLRVFQAENFARMEGEINISTRYSACLSHEKNGAKLRKTAKQKLKKIKQKLKKKIRRKLKKKSGENSKCSGWFLSRKLPHFC